VLKSIEWAFVPIRINTRRQMKPIRNLSSSATNLIESDFRMPINSIGNEVHIKDAMVIFLDSKLTH